MLSQFRLGVLAAVGAISLASSANAAVIITSVQATNPYTGPVPTYNFDTPTPIVGGTITNTTISGQHQRPFGSTGNFLSVGPLDGTSAVLSLASFSRIGQISLLWGSADVFNTVQLLDSANNVIATITGTDVRPTVFTSPLTPGQVNRLVTLTFTDAVTQAAIKAIRFSSNRNAFEIDNVAVRAVPEPTTWLMLIAGFAGVAFGLRRRPAKQQLRVRYV